MNINTKEFIQKEYEKSQKDIQAAYLLEGWYKTTPNTFDYFTSGFEAGLKFSLYLLEKRMNNEKTSR